MIVDPISGLNPISHTPDAPQGGKWYMQFIKPAVLLLLFLLASYTTLWMGQHYVTQDKFGVYVEKQIQADKMSQEESRKRFEVTQEKLETIINNQTMFAEQLKAINQLQSVLEKKVDSIDQRVIYLERHIGSSVNTSKD